MISEGLSGSDNVFTLRDGWRLPRSILRDDPRWTAWLKFIPQEFSKLNSARSYLSAQVSLELLFAVAVGSTEGNDSVCTKGQNELTELLKADRIGLGSD